MDTTESSTRTLGDGMDNTCLQIQDQHSKNTSFNIQKAIRKNPIVTFKPIEIDEANRINLVPKYQPQERKVPKNIFKKPKPTKFIPYEPYKAAIEPILTHSPIQQQKHPTGIKPIPSEPKKSTSVNNNNVEIQDLVTQLSDLRTNELLLNIQSNSEHNNIRVGKEKLMVARDEWIKEKNTYETDIKNLRESNAHLENQLKFQLQVNGELKTLLVASLGEDLESRVQHLTEDKLQLARALLNSANHLTTHQEQTEWLTGQCEVWRSKFLASSLMVEELAHWKSALTSRINDLQEVVKGFLEERKQLQKNLMNMNSQLNCVMRNYKKDSNAPVSNGLKSANAIDLAETILITLGSLCDNLHIDADQIAKEIAAGQKLAQCTANEVFAKTLIQNVVSIPKKHDAACNALMGTALSINGRQMYLQHPSSCCAHCTGDMQNI